MPINLQVIPVKSVIPNERNPRGDFGDLVALAATFAVNPERPGEPITPPLVVQDGDIYRIIDGERRWRAMKDHADIEEFTAYVADGYDDANAMLAMLATDDNINLTSLEKSRGVQQALLLGDVTTERLALISNAAGVERKSLRMALRGIKKVKKPETLTIDHLAAIGEFEAAEDEEAVLQLSKAKEGNWEALAVKLWADRDRKEKVYQLKLSCDMFDVPVEYVKNSWEGVKGYKGAGTYEDESAVVTALQELIQKYEEGMVARIFEGSQWSAPSLTLYIPKNEGEEDSEEPEETPEQKARRELFARHAEAWPRDAKRREEFCRAFAAQWDAGPLFALLMDFAVEKFDYSPSYYYGLLEGHGYLEKRYHDLLTALIDEGYELSPEETELYNIVSAIDFDEEEEEADDEG